MSDFQDLIKEYLEYNPDTGEFIWIKAPAKNKPQKVGEVAGCPCYAGLRIKLKGNEYLAHRMAFIYMSGFCPEHIAHKDGDKINNRWDNLFDRSEQVITQDYLKEHFYYNPDTGDMVAIKMRQGLSPHHLGSPIRNKDDNGYYRVSILGRDYRVHRLAFLYMTGSFPDNVDHINRVRSDNRWCNLRPCTRSQNQWNMTGYGKSGIKGVRQAGKRGWQARICKEGKEIHIGYYQDPKEAAEAYNAKATELFGEFASLNVIE